MDYGVDDRDNDDAEYVDDDDDDRDRVRRHVRLRNVLSRSVD